MEGIVIPVSKLQEQRVVGIMNDFFQKWVFGVPCTSHVVVLMLADGWEAERGKVRG